MGLKILTDTLYRKPIECEISEYIVMNYGVMSSRFFAHAPPSQDVRTGMSSPEQAPFTDVRKYFPETWIWQLVPVGSSGSASLPLTVPDSITEWKGSTFCTGAAGFGISETVSFNAFKPFFVELALPYSVIRTEAFTLKAKVFNFLKSCIMVKVKLLEAQGFNVNAESSFEYKSCVCSKDSVTISWKLEATKLGEHNITVRAESIPSDTPCGNEVVTVPDKGAIDVIRKALLIKPEGTETELTHSSLICPKGMSVTEQIPLRVPEDVVEGSSRAYITVLGDLLGSAMENLDGLLRLPTGCGEQNMVKFAPNIYVLRYLNKTNQLTGQILERTTGYLRTGYQNQLRYKHSDGSFSAFGDNDPEGNTWLTAFVLRSFLEAQQHISIQEEILRKSAQFFLKHQLVSGCFASLGQLFNNAMKGGVDDLISLSAYVTTTLLQLEKNDPYLANDIYTKHLVDITLPEHQLDYKEWDESTGMPTLTPPAVGTANFKTGVTDQALSCLIDALGTVNNTYTLSLLAYTFTLAGDQLNRGKVLHRLEDLAVQKDGLTHWQRKEKSEEDRGYWWRAPSAEVEMTAYVLLALLSQPQVPRSDLDQATSIVSWLVKQRNSYGGFASTQDTVVALQALALYAELTHVTEPHSSLSISSPSGLHQEFHIDSSNQLLLQVQPLAEVPGDYSVEVSGTSCLLLQTTLRYNVPAKQKEDVFTLSVEMMATGTKDRNNLEGPQYKININVTFTGQRPVSNMVLVDVMMLSGFSALRESYQDSLDRRNISKSEIQDGHMVLYVQPMESNRLLQLSILTVQDFEVENLQPAIVKVYDYYETDESVEAEYEAPKGPEIV
ncbi:alpha-2-macroglobulin-like [Carcharodon carcharias]|uniref:alpha-2-macroglobulin-like n=1 Tax=Carcharodon carcharias TaxID=13397 RepID=UPI001B7DB3B7|nr:alpha-2-macroglobulin-like [Carcharodon carcharias]